MEEAAVVHARGSDRRLRTVPAILPVTAAVVLMFVLAFSVGRPDGALIVFNPSPSMPPGFYLRTAIEPARGAIVAFDIPAAALAHAQDTDPRIGWRQFLKPVAAVEGDTVCVSFERGLHIDGTEIAPVARTDSQGATLPVWNHCRRLIADEFFVYAPRVRTSFDSRSYGPVRRNSIRGVYVPLWTW